MILVDTSVWVDHLRFPDPMLARLLTLDQVLLHPFVIGEISMGNFARRADFLASLKTLPQIFVAENDEVMDLTDRRHLFGTGIGFIDTHLLASLHLTPGTKLWSRDKRLAAIATGMDLCFNPDKFLH